MVMYVAANIQVRVNGDVISHAGGISMGGGTITVHCLFKKAGLRTLRLSPDDVTILADKKVRFAEAVKDKLEFGELEIERTSPTSVAFSFTHFMECRFVSI